MIENRKTILFDMDGVLVDSEPQHYRTWNRIYKTMGFQMPWETYMPCIGTTLPYLFGLVEDYIGHPLPDHEGLLERYKKELDQLREEEGPAAVPGVPGILAELKNAGYRMAVASSSPIREIEKTIRDIGAEEYFELLFSGETVEHCKPAPDTFLQCAEAVGADPSDCIVIEDSYNGTRAARAADMYCIGIQNPGSGNQDLSAADIIVGTLEGIRGLLL